VEKHWCNIDVLLVALLDVLYLLKAAGKTSHQWGLKLQEEEKRTQS
jgi:hypothetical protein